MFVLKKFLSVWLMPLPVCLLLLVVGWWLSRSKHRGGFGRFLLTCGVLLLLAFTNKFVSSWLIRPLESAFPPIPEITSSTPLTEEVSSCRTVVVLGGGNGEAIGMAALDRLSASSRARLTEGVRIVRALPGARLVVTGGPANGGVSHAVVQADAAISLGITSERIIRIETARDTEEEAEVLSRTLGQEPFVLVTSAWHMRRAMALMLNRGLRPVPCPCDYTVRRAATTTWTDYLWDTESLGRSTWAVYERLGFLWARARDRI